MDVGISLVVMMSLMGCHGGAGTVAGQPGHHVAFTEITNIQDDFNAVPVYVKVPNVTHYPVAHPRSKRQAAAALGAAGTAATAAPSWTTQVGAVMDTANSFLGVVSTGVSIATSVVGIISSIQDMAIAREKHEMAQRQFEFEMEMKVIDLCEKICVTEWGPWQTCTARCGGGWTERSREYFNGGKCEDHVCSHSIHQTAQCNVGCPNNGIASGTGSCSCPLEYNGDCCDEEIRCQYPGKPRNGDVQVPTQAGYGSIAEFSCDEAFSIVGEEVLVCQDDNSWRGARPECLKIKCTTPNQPLHGRLINQKLEYLFGEEAVFLCDDGYELRGPERRTCRSFGDSEGFFGGFTPMCLPVSCGVPEYPIYGTSHGTEFTLGSVVTYECEQGFRLVGSSERTCLSTGAWSGHTPECQQLKCEEPDVARNGDFYRHREEYNYGVTIRYECDEGYRLEGETTARCEANVDAIFIGLGGRWSNPAPECLAAICGEPAPIENGAKSGNIYYYPHSITFTCFTGHVMRGEQEITCEANGVWSGVTPVCEPCEVGLYKSSTDPFEECSACPANSATSAAGSTSINQCRCEHGYSGPPGGPCEEITCPVLTAPEYGFINDCGNQYSHVCEFDCEDGYIMERGSSRRTCDENGQWTGSNAVCSPCSKNTYKAELRSCLPCPRYSHTGGEASMPTDCVCDDGYSGPDGGPCADVDDCEGNDGRGPCDDICENLDGTYRCQCSIPGYVIKNDIDPHNCIVEQTCRNLTVDDAPENGGLVCHWYIEQNSQQCGVRCNDHYEFPSRTNNYETCGMTTGYEWSHEERGESIEPCVPEFFPNVRLEADSKYFVRACPDLTPQEQEDVKSEFARMLTEQGVCVRSETQVCNVRNVGIICGRTTRRRRRGVMEEVDEVDLAFELQALQVGNQTVLDCDQICQLLRIPQDRCPNLCESTYKRYLQAAVIFSKTVLETAFQDSSSVRFQAAARTFEPRDDPLQANDVEVLCPDGMRDDGGICIPCHAGSYFHQASNKCKRCTRGTYQPQAQQYECLTCPHGTYVLTEGATQCQECPDKRWGLYCMNECQCVNGDCHPETGECQCEHGWEGTNCDNDINGCVDNACFEPSSCVDTAAPGTGYSCTCPDGYQGDGYWCEPATPTIRKRSISAFLQKEL